MGSCGGGGCGLNMVSFIQRKRRKQGEGCFSGDLMANTTAIY